MWTSQLLTVSQELRFRTPGAETHSQWKCCISLVPLSKTQQLTQLLGPLYWHLLAPFFVLAITFVILNVLTLIFPLCDLKLTTCNMN